MSRLMEGKAFAVLQQIGTAFFLPVSILPGAGLLLGIGASFTNQNTVSTYGLTSIMGPGTVLNILLMIMTAVGSTIFGNLPIIFAMAVALGLAKQEKAVAVLTSGISFFVMNATIHTMLQLSGQILTDGKIADGVMAGAITNVCGIESLQMGVFGGILTGIIVALLNNRFYKQELPAVFSFFAGTRFVPLVSMVTFVFVGIAAFYVWPFIQRIIFSIGDVVLATSYLGTFVFGFVERLLIPFGLHHVFYIPFWQTGMGGSAIVDGVRVFGAQNIFFAELASPNTERFSVEACRFMTGKYAVMMAGLPGAALAMYHCAKPEKRKLVGGLLLSAALTSFFTGITEPIEFTFLFIAPALYVLHCALAGLSFLLMHMMNICIGTTFSCGLVDFTLYGLLQGTEKTNWLMILPVFVVYFILYYVIFKTVILKFDLKTPGRSDDAEVKLYSKADYKKKQAKESQETSNAVVDEVSAQIAQGLGGVDNVRQITCCATRLRLTLADMNKVNELLLKKTGAVGIIRRGEGLQVIYGPKVSVIKSNFEEYVEAVRIQGKARDQKKEEVLLTPLVGEIVSLQNVPDEAFASGMLGRGIAINPSEGKVFAPAAGTVTTLFPTAHAIGLKTDEGAELLVHIGLDTVKLNGRYFQAKVRQGEHVEQGQLLITFELEKIIKEGYQTITPVLLVNHTRYSEVGINTSGHIKKQEKLFFLTM